MGYEWAKDIIHVPFGLVSLEEGTMSTREGRVVFLEDVLNRAIDETREHHPAKRALQRTISKKPQSRSASVRLYSMNFPITESRTMFSHGKRFLTSTEKPVLMYSTPMQEPQAFSETQARSLRQRLGFAERSIRHISQAPSAYTNLQN